jgi:dephospho-CoA kinase
LTRLPQALLLTGTIGAGKTAIAVGIGRRLEDAGHSAAVVDLDWLGWVHRAQITPAQMIAANLAAIWPNLVNAGIEYVVLARGLRSSEELDAIRGAVLGSPLKVVRIVSSRELIEQRLRRRDAGAVLEEHLAESRDFDATGAELADITVENDRRRVETVAAEILAAAGRPG